MGIEPMTPFLPRTCSAPELLRRYKGIIIPGKIGDKIAEYCFNTQV